MKKKPRSAPSHALLPRYVPGVGLVHPDDDAAASLLRPHCKVFRITGEAEGWALLAYAGTTLRVRPSTIEPIDTGARDVGELVALRDGSEAEVLSVTWHHNEQQPFYTLKVAGKKKSKRYWNDDLAI